MIYKKLTKNILYKNDYDFKDRKHLSIKQYKTNHHIYHLILLIINKHVKNLLKYLSFLKCS